jgi:hypothetical protein
MLMQMLGARNRVFTGIRKLYKITDDCEGGWLRYGEKREDLVR